MSRQNTTEVFRKHFMAKRVRIRAWQESGDSAINMANHLGRLGHQKLKKEYFAGPCFLCPGGSLASSRMGQTCPKTSFYPSFLKFFVKKRDFLAFCRFFCSQKSCFLAIFSKFLKNRYPFFLMNGWRHHWFNNLNRFPIYITTLFMFGRCGKTIF